MYGLGADPFQGQDQGPLAGMQDAIAATLNSADANRIYIPTPGPGNPIVSVPRNFPAYWGRSRTARSYPTTLSPGEKVAFAIFLIVVIVGGFLYLTFS